LKAEPLLILNANNNIALTDVRIMTTADVAGATKFSLSLYKGSKPHNDENKLLDNLLAEEKIPSAGGKVESFELGKHFGLSLGLILDINPDAMVGEGVDPFDICLTADAPITAKIGITVFMRFLSLRSFRECGTMKQASDAEIIKATN
jgi:hypothetical protein